MKAAVDLVSQAHRFGAGILLLFLSGWSDPASARMQASPETVITVTETDFRIYRGDGTPTTMEEMLAEAARADVVFVGESHNDPIAHHIEQEVLVGVHKRAETDRVALSLEMFSRDVQYIVDEYLEGLITEPHFLSSSNPWDNYGTDYRPLVEYARENGLDVIAANSPRRYTNRVTRHGRESLGDLSERARRTLAPLPYGAASSGYRRQWIGVMGEDVDVLTDTLHELSMANMLDAQSLWDATMAYSIAEFLVAHRDAHVVHAVGSFHVNHYTGIPEHLAAYRPDVSMLVISIATTDDIETFLEEDHAELGDYVVLADESLPRTY